VKRDRFRAASVYIGGVSDTIVREHLEKVLSSRTFSNADRLRQLLRFTVERTLDGGGDQIKEYLLGVEVFGRGDDYDPRMDAIVRVEARRLRQKLSEYYAGEGASDTWRIQVRKGSYVPVVEPVAGAGRRRVAFAWLAAAAFGVVGAVIWFNSGPDAPSALDLAVIPQQRDGEAANRITLPLAELVSLELAKEASISVTAWPVVAARLRLDEPASELARSLNVASALVLNTSVSAGQATVTAHLFGVSSQRKAWAGEYDFPADEFTSRRQELAQAIASRTREALGSLKRRGRSGPTMNQMTGKAASAVLY